MADVQISSNESQEDLVGFFTGFNDLLEQLDSDADNFGTEYLERKLEDYVTILLGMIFKLESGESSEHRNNEPTSQPQHRQTLPAWKGIMTSKNRAKLSHPTPF